MGQVTIYLDDEIEQKMNAAVRAAKISKSKWIASIVQEKVANEWPQSVVGMAGSWGDFPSLEDVRAVYSTDIQREPL